MTDFTNNTYLLDEIKKGSNDAFEFLFKSYFPRLFGYAVRFVENEDDARDLVQEVFLTFWERREQITSISLTSLLFTMVRNSCLNNLKHRQIVKKHQISYIADIAGEEQLYHADFWMHTEGPLLYSELETQINHVIRTLPDRCREVFLLSRYEGLKNREVAEKLKISTTAVEKHIGRAISAFEKYFKNKYPGNVYLLILIFIYGVK